MGRRRVRPVSAGRLGEGVRGPVVSRQEEQALPSAVVHGAARGHPACVRDGEGGDLGPARQGELERPSARQLQASGSLTGRRNEGQQFAVAERLEGDLLGETGERSVKEKAESPPERAKG